MNRIYTLLVFLIVFLMSIKAQQQETEPLIQEGITLHSEGLFQEAIDRYNEALRLDSTNILAIYEISLSYLAMENYENAISYSTRVLDSDNHILSVGAYAVKSEALAATDRIDEAVALLESGLKRHPFSYILHYNLALNYYKKNNLDKALYHIRKAIDVDKSHSEAFLLHAYILNDKSLWVRSILSFQMFLLLEPDSHRSRPAFDELLRTMHIRTSSDIIERPFIQQQMMRNQSEPETTGFLVAPSDIPPLSIENGVDRRLIYNAITTSLDSLRVDSLENDLFMTFKTVNKEIIRMLDKENDGSEEKEGIYWTFFIPFFAHIVHSEHFETYCRYISVSYIPESLEWWNDNPDCAERFVTWFVEGTSIPLDEELEDQADDYLEDEVENESDQSLNSVVDNTTVASSVADNEADQYSLSIETE